MNSFRFKKLVNFRFIFLLFVLTLYCVFFTEKAYIQPLYLLAIFIPVVLFVVFLIVKKKFVCLLITILLLSFTCTYTGFYIKNYTDTSFNNINYIVCGKVSHISRVSNDFSYLILENVNLTNESGQKIFPRGKMSIKVKGENSNNVFSQYSIIKFSTKIKGIDLYESGKLNSFFLREKIKYENENIIYSNDISKVGFSQTLSEKFREYNRRLLTLGMGEEKGNISYAVLYGDKSLSDKEFINKFRISGTAHIFTVSGLHVSLLILLISFILKKLKLNDKTNLCISFIILLIFSYLCNFSSSVIRASIMGLTLLLSNVLWKKYDSLNALSLAGLFLILINPLNIFDVGFLMSFFAVFGILMFGSVFRKVIIPNKFLNSLFQSMVISLSAQLGLIPIFMKYYGYVGTYSILANLFIVPIFSLYYIILFILNLLIIILPFLKFLYLLPLSFLEVLAFINSLIISLPYSTIKLSQKSTIFTLVYYFNMYFVSKYFCIHNKPKIILESLVVCCLIINSILICAPRIVDSDKMLFLSDKSFLGVLYETKENNFYLINPNLSNSKKIRNELENLKIEKLNGIILFNEQSFNGSEVNYYLEDYCATYYMTKGNSGIGSLEFNNNKVFILENNMQVIIDNDFAVKIYEYENDCLAGLINIGINKIAFISPNSEMNNDTINFIKSNFNFSLDCVKIYLDKTSSYWKDILDSKKLLFNNQFYEYSL